MNITILDDYHDTVRTLTCFSKTRRPQRHDLERSHQGCRYACRTSEGHRGAGADPRAHADPRGADRAPAQAQAYQPAQRVSAHRHRCLHETWRHRVLGHACGHAVVCDGGTDVGADHRGDAPDSAADGRAQGGQVADRHRFGRARQNAGDLRLRPNRQRRRRLRQGIRHEGAGVGHANRRCARARADGYSAARSKEAFLRGVRRHLAAHALSRRDARHRHRAPISRA